MIHPGAVLIAQVAEPLVGLTPPSSPLKAGDLPLITERAKIAVMPLSMEIPRDVGGYGAVDVYRS